jgi:hypothetical protein
MPNLNCLFKKLKLTKRLNFTLCITFFNRISGSRRCFRIELIYLLVNINILRQVRQAKVSWLRLYTKENEVSSCLTY